ncbi:MAG: TRAM domain-containing protein [Candidatus Omnitrophota bacterium]
MDIELRIEKLVFGGDGLGFVGGKACFVEGALPEEKVLARISSDKPNFMKARLVHVLEPSPHRIHPPCPYIERCGGCQYQHLPYPEELKWKENQVRESFSQAFKTGEIPVLPIQHGSKEYGYRKSITIHRTTEKNNKPQRLGFIGHDNYSKVLINYCMLADERLREVFTAEHKLNRREEKRAFKLDEKGRIFSSDEEKLYRVSVNGRSFWTSSMGFFQNNIEVTELIAKKLTEYIAVIKPSRFLDLYAGVGTFPLLVAHGVPETHCFEDSPYSTGCLRRNVKELELPLAGIFAGKVEKTFPHFIVHSPNTNQSKRSGPNTYQLPQSGNWGRPSHHLLKESKDLGGDWGSSCPHPEEEMKDKDNPKLGTLVFMDPPRQGIASSLAGFLAREDAGENILYLACDLQILLRDLKQILVFNRYRIREVIPFDMFPRTKHIEVLAWLTRI